MGCHPVPIFLSVAFACLTCSRIAITHEFYSFILLCSRSASCRFLTAPRETENGCSGGHLPRRVVCSIPRRISIEDQYHPPAGYNPIQHGSPGNTSPDSIHTRRGAAATFRVAECRPDRPIRQASGCHAQSNDRTRARHFVVAFNQQRDHPGGCLQPAVHHCFGQSTYHASRRVAAGQFLPDRGTDTHRASAFSKGL